MPPLTPLPTASSWSEEIAEAAREFYNGLLTIIDPGTPGTYDPVTDTMTGGNPDTILIADRPARAQHLGLPTQGSDVTGWNVKRRFRFQCDVLEGDPIIRKGLVATFTGGSDPSLAEYTFQVVSAVNSSHAALRTIECTTELGTES
jgi:hypothetical protein